MKKLFLPVTTFTDYLYHLLIFFLLGKDFAALTQSLQCNSLFQGPKRSLFKYSFSASNYRQVKGSFFVFVLGTYYSSGNMHVCRL